jgi:hypothetical protein
MEAVTNQQPLEFDYDLFYAVSKPSICARFWIASAEQRIPHCDD